MPEKKAEQDDSRMIIGNMVGDLAIAGMDVSHVALGRASERLRLETASERFQERVSLFQGSLTYKDARLSGFDAACVVEVVEHLDPPRLAAFTSGSRIRIMPDVHAGSGCAIGTTMTIANKVVPNLVGVDIGCGMETVRLVSARVNLPELDSFIHQSIPAGMEVRPTPHKYLAEARLDELRCKRQLNINRGQLSLR